MLVDLVLGALKVDYHWYDDKVYEIVLEPLVDVIGSWDRMVELCNGFVMPANAPAMENATLALVVEGLVSHLRIFFDPTNIDIKEDEGEVYEAKALQQHRVALENFMENAWEVFKARVVNSNLDAFSRYMDTSRLWFSVGNLVKVLEVGRCLAVIYQYLKL